MQLAKWVRRPACRKCGATSLEDLQGGGRGCPRPSKVAVPVVDIATGKTTEDNARRYPVCAVGNWTYWSDGMLELIAKKLVSVSADALTIKSPRHDQRAGASSWSTESQAGIEWHAICSVVDLSHCARRPIPKRTGCPRGVRLGNIARIGATSALIRQNNDGTWILGGSRR